MTMTDSETGTGTEEPVMPEAAADEEEMEDRLIITSATHAEQWKWVGSMEH